jgi:hypothetical protein
MRPVVNDNKRPSILPSNRGPVIVMGMVVLGSVAAVMYSHYAQVRDKTVMRQGVERDKERLRRIREQQQQGGGPGDSSAPSSSS